MNLYKTPINIQHIVPKKKGLNILKGHISYSWSRDYIYGNFSKENQSRFYSLYDIRPKVILEQLAQDIKNRI